MNSIDFTHPHLIREWHNTRNVALTPGMFTSGSGKKIWWQCDVAPDHEWLAPIHHRVNGTGCPICSGKKVVRSNCLATTHPALVKEWHPHKNGPITAFDVFSGSHKKVWWTCPKNSSHQWIAQINRRASRGHGCPYCSGHKVDAESSFATIKKDLMEYWDQIKNDLDPNTVAPYSNKKVWWKCPKGEDHIWQAPICSISNGTRCPVCAGRKVVNSNSLKFLYPEIAQQWHPTSNGNRKPDQFTVQSNKKVWWKCPKGEDHEWQEIIGKRTSRGFGCPICSNRQVRKSNSLAALYPQIAIEWHQTKNGNLYPEDVVPGSHKIFWWQCDVAPDHEWLSTVKDRRFNGCPVCANQKVVSSNCLASTHPHLINTWDLEKNTPITPYDVVSGSDKAFWWVCEFNKDHKWKTSVYNVSRANTNCPYCTLTPQSKQELTITFELTKLFKNIDPKGLKTPLDGRLRSIDIYIPKLNLCIEFDGAYWHKDKREIDKIKSEMILKEGFKLIRVREEPLKKIYDTDVISRKPFDGKQVTNDILTVVMRTFDLNDALVSKIEEYQEKEELQNEKGLDRYIDKILTDKAEKKQDL